MFELLSRLEKMSHVIKSVGNIEHEVYPQMNNYCIVLLYGWPHPNARPLPGKRAWCTRTMHDIV